MNSNPQIHAVHCPYVSDSQEPEGATVGYNGVTRIEKRDENLGTYGIAWFDIYQGDNLYKSLNAMTVQVVYYVTS